MLGRDQVLVLLMVWIAEDVLSLGSGHILRKRSACFVSGRFTLKSGKLAGYAGDVWFPQPV
jgi:hypothetical protein